MNKPSLDTKGLSLTPDQIKQLVHNDFYNKIFSQLREALIMNNLIYNTSGSYSIGEVSFDKEGKIQEARYLPDSERDPVDVSGDISKIDLLRTKDQLFQLVDQYWDMDKDEKKKIKAAIKDFIFERFLTPQKEIRRKRSENILKNDYFLFIKNLAEEKARERSYTIEQKELYKNIGYSISWLVAKNNPSYLDANGEINQEWLKFIAKVFLRAIKHIPTLWSSKAVHNIFHDGDFRFLRIENGDKSPKIWTLDHYIRAIMYLMDQNWFNPFATWGYEGLRERNTSKISFLNTLYKTLSYKEETTKENFPDKESIHYNLSYDWARINEISSFLNAWISVNRYKTEASRLSKLASKGTESLTDESGLRSIYYGDPKDQENIFKHINQVSIDYIKKLYATPWVTIHNITTATKGGFITPDQEKNLIEGLEQNLAILWTSIPNIEERRKKSDSVNFYTNIKNICEESLSWTPSPALEQAYHLASGKISRGGNGDYKDFKLIVELSIDKGIYQEIAEPHPLIDEKGDKSEKVIPLFQEISFYPISNDLNMGNHHFLDLEKRIDTRISNMNDPELGKSISLNRLRWFVESSLKDISFDIDIYEEKIKKGLLVKPETDDYKYLQIDGEKISLKDLISRTEQNSERFDRLICHVLNYFIRENKLIYINMDKTHHFGLLTPENLAKDSVTKTRRFTIPKVLKSIAINPKYQEGNICFYHPGDNPTTPDFEVVNFGELNKLFRAENMIRKNAQESVRK